MDEITNSAPIGVENLVYAILIDEKTKRYETPAIISPAIKVKVDWMQINS